MIVHQVMLPTYGLAYAQLRLSHTGGPLLLQQSCSLMQFLLQLCSVLCMHAVLGHTLRPACMGHPALVPIIPGLKHLTLAVADLQCGCQALQCCLQLTTIPLRPGQREVGGPPL